MVQYQKILTLSLIPAVTFAFLSFLSIILTTHYWILTDYFVGRWLKRKSTFPEAKKFPWDDVIVDYTETSTNATITSGCLCLAAAINCIIAYFKLKPNTMDLDYHSVCSQFRIRSNRVTDNSIAIEEILGGQCDRHGPRWFVHCTRISHHALYRQRR